MSEAMADGGAQPRLEIMSRREEPIRTLEEWQEFAPPARALHWKEGRSAMELARLWLGGEGQRLTGALLSGHPPLAGFVADSATAEAQVSFDEHRGGRRNHDLLLEGRTDRGPAVVGIEAKADESFGQTLGAYQAAAERHIATGQRTNALARLEGLSRRILGRETLKDADLRLRYQLFSATAGTLAAARDHRAVQAVLLIHEFLGNTDERRVAQNTEDLAAFLRVAFGTDLPRQSEWVLGPLAVPGDGDIGFYVAKLTTHLEDADAPRQGR